MLKKRFLQAQTRIHLLKRIQKNTRSLSQRNTSVTATAVKRNEKDHIPDLDLDHLLKVDIRNMMRKAGQDKNEN